MKKLIAMMLILCMLAPLAANAEVWAKLNQKIATRTGPATKYNEPGTFLRSGDYVLVRSKVWDDRNDIWWVQVEFTPSSGYNGDKIRAYTGAKRMNVDLNKVPTEYALQNCRVIRDADGFAGPWYDGFVAWSDTIYAGTSATLLEVENGFAHIECWNSWRGCWWRGWVRLDTLDCASSYRYDSYYGFADDNTSYGGSNGGYNGGYSGGSGSGNSQPDTTRAPSTYYGNTSGYPVGCTVTIVSSSANARSGPGTDYREIGTVMHDEVFKILACSEGNTEKDWYRIHLGAPYNTDAWISSGVCSIN